MSRSFMAGRPSPAIVVAVLALVAALAGSAVAGSDVQSSAALNKKKVKKIAKKQINKLAPGLSVANADNADALGGQSPSAFETTSASDDGGDTSVTLGTANTTVLSTTITVPSPKTVTAVASVEAFGDGGGNDFMLCNAEIAGTNGTRLEVGPAEREALPVTQSRSVGAGTHTVRVECAKDSAGASVEARDRSLSVVATG